MKKISSWVLFGLLVSVSATFAMDGEDGDLLGQERGRQHHAVSNEAIYNADNDAVKVNPTFSLDPTRDEAQHTLSNLMGGTNTTILELVLDELYKPGRTELDIINRPIELNDLAAALNQFKSPEDQEEILNDKLAGLYNS